jgi:hypothetical protein
MDNMMKYILPALLLSATSVMAQQTVTEEQLGAGAVTRPTIMVYGPIVNQVALSCAAFNASPEPLRNAYEWWILGYVSGATGLAAYYGYKLADSDVPGLLAWAHQYCDTHPLTTIDNAAAALFVELRTRAIKLKG